MNGCNLFSAGYFAFNNGTISFDQFEGNANSCNEDYDYLYLNALADSYSYVQNNKEITFKDDRGNITIILTLVETSSFSSLSGTNNINSSSQNNANSYQNNANSSGQNRNNSNNNTQSN